MSRPFGIKSTPSYCLHKSSGRDFATLNGLPVYLGKHGTPEGWEKFDRILGVDYLRSGRTTPHEQAAAHK